MNAPRRSTEKFLEGYEQQYPQFKREAELVRGLVLEIAERSGASVHAVRARAKSPESVRDKLRRKHYDRPESQLTDLIGVRIITTYSDEVDLVASKLRESFVISQHDSIDERTLLGQTGFGYRSVHLVARLKGAQARNRRYRILQDQWFEVQVRTILEHAWAEISHEIAYKSGVEYPPPLVRKFSSLAGTLELLDNEFLTIRDERNQLIDEYRAIYADGTRDRKAFDVARLLGFMEAIRPEGNGWRQATKNREPFQQGLDVACVDALRHVGLGTSSSLGRMLECASFEQALFAFASANGIAPQSVSHLALVLIALALKRPAAVTRFFPDIVCDAALQRACKL
ncbi:MAG: hypothetical protein AAGA91_19170 [Pseudomonadota bacterium]